jgi:hypothetical protein
MSPREHARTLLLRWLPGVGGAVAVLMIWLVSVDLPFLPGTDLDPSWGAALVDAHLQARQFGKDIVFTYGPLGFLWSSFCLPDALPAKLVWEFLGKLGFALTFYALVRRLPGARRFMVLGLLVLSASHFDDVIPVFLALVALLWLMPGDARVWQRVLAVIWFAFLSHVKFTYCLQVAAGVGLAGVVLVWGGRWRVALAQALGFLSAFLVVWLAAGQRLANLPAYLRLNWEVASGHNWAMGVAGSTPVLVLALLVMAGNAGLAWRIWRASGERRVAVCTTLVLGACWFLVWKHGMLRADAHPFGFFLSNLLLAATLPGALSVKQRMFWTPLASILCLAGMVATSWGMTKVIPGIVWGQLRQMPKVALHLAGYRAGFVAEFARQSLDGGLPGLREAVGKGTVDLLNCEQGFLLRDRLAYRPRPVMQSYVASTPMLAAANARFFASPDAPDFVVLRFFGLDDHFLMMDDGPALATLARRYQVAKVAPGYALLRRTPGPAQPQPTPEVLVEQVVKWNQEIALPEERGHALWMQVAIRPTLLGRLVALLYRPPELRFWVTDSEGQATSYRLIADVARAGFFVQPLVRQHVDFAALVNRQGSRWTRSVRFQRPDQAWLWSRPKVRFSRLPDLELRATP